MLDLFTPALNLGYSILISNNRANKCSCKLCEFMLVLNKWCEFIPFFAFIRKCSRRIEKIDLTLVSSGSFHEDCEELSNIE